MTEKELEKLFRKKFDGRSFEFNPSAWAGAEKLIVEGERRRRRRIIFGWSAAASVLFMGGIMTYAILTTPDMGVGQDMIAWPSQQEEVIPIPGEPVIASETDFDDSHSIQSIEPDGALQLGTSISSAAITSQPSIENSTANLSEAQNAGSSDDGSTLSFVNSTVEQVTQEIIEGRADALSPSEERISMPSVTLAETESLNPQEELATVSEADTEEASVSFTEESIDELSSEESASPIITRPKQVVQPWTFGLEGGFNASQLSGGSRGFVPSLYGGLFAGYQFTDSWTIQSGVTYARRSNYGARQDRTSSDYGFGSRVIELEVTASTVDYIEIPLLMNYEFGKHQLSFGAYAAFKTISNSQVTRTVTETLAGSESTSYVAQGYEDGSAPFDAGLSVGYSYSLTDRWMLSANGMLGLADGYQMESSGSNKHIQLRLGAKYLLWK